jgi:hypothetical protein
LRGLAEMIWPFKKREKPMPFSEFVKTLEPAPCGEQEKHYEWKLNGVPCPACVAIKQHKRKDAELDLLANKIVAKLRQPLDDMDLANIYERHSDEQWLEFARAVERAHGIGAGGQPMGVQPQEWCDREGGCFCKFRNVVCSNYVATDVETPAPADPFNPRCVECNKPVTKPGYTCFACVKKRNAGVTGGRPSDVLTAGTAEKESGRHRDPPIPAAHPP